jgi:hypothetical protein
MSRRTLAARLARIEQRLGELPCPVCQGASNRITTHTEYRHSDGSVTCDPPIPPPCTGCSARQTKEQRITCIIIAEQIVDANEESR